MFDCFNSTNCKTKDKVLAVTAYYEGKTNRQAFFCLPPGGRGTTKWWKEQAEAKAENRSLLRADMESASTKTRRYKGIFDLPKTTLSFRCKTKSDAAGTSLPPCSDYHCQSLCNCLRQLHRPHPTVIKATTKRL